MRYQTACEMAPIAYRTLNYSSRRSNHAGTDTNFICSDIPLPILFLSPYHSLWDTLQ